VDDVPWRQREVYGPVQPEDNLADRQQVRGQLRVRAQFERRVATPCLMLDDIGQAPRYKFAAHDPFLFLAYPQVDV
jgi:hypothetical protein